MLIILWFSRGKLDYYLRENWPTATNQNAVGGFSFTSIAVHQHAHQTE